MPNWFFKHSSVLLYPEIHNSDYSSRRCYPTMMNENLIEEEAHVSVKDVYIVSIIKDRE